MINKLDFTKVDMPSITRHFKLTEGILENIMDVTGAIIISGMLISALTLIGWGAMSLVMGIANV